MPTLPPAGNVIKVQLQHTLATDVNCFTHLYFSYSGSAPSASALNTWCNTIVSAWTSDLQSLHGNDVELTEVIATDLSATSGNRGTTSASAIGTRTGGVLPASTALLVNFQIRRRYRGGKPRAYFPAGVDSDLETAQSWTPAFLAAFNTGLNAFIAAVEGTPPAGTSALALCSVGYFSGYTLGPAQPGGFRKKIPTPLATPHVDAVFNYTLNTRPGSQRRRLRSG